MKTLGERIKEFFENRTRFYLPKKSYTVIRIDGKNFSSYTKNFDKPFDEGMNQDMAQVAMTLCQEIPGAILAYTQSDEVSVISCDFAKQNSESWFDGNLQKIVSVSASIASKAFNANRIARLWRGSGDFALEDATNFAVFDSRAFTMPSRIDLEDYLVWRQNDCIRNSVSMAARSSFSHKALLGKSSKEMKEMLRDVGKPWESYPDRSRIGLVVYKKEEVKDVVFTKPDGEVVVQKDVVRKVWDYKSILFTEDREFLRKVIPIRGE